MTDEEKHYEYEFCIDCDSLYAGIVEDNDLKCNRYFCKECKSVWGRVIP